MAIITHIEENEPSPVALTKHSCPLCSYEWWELTDAGDYPCHCPGCGEPYSPWDSEVYAETDGRLARLPVKIGQTLYAPNWAKGIDKVFVTSVTFYEESVKISYKRGKAIFDCEIGSTSWRNMYTTYAEAEAVLKAREAGG